MSYISSFTVFQCLGGTRGRRYAKIFLRANGMQVEMVRESKMGFHEGIRRPQFCVYQLRPVSKSGPASLVSKDKCGGSASLP